MYGLTAGIEVTQSPRPTHHRIRRTPITAPAEPTNITTLTRASHPDYWSALDIRAVDTTRAVDHGATAGCILFLVVGGAALTLLLLRLREGQGPTGLGRFASIAVSDMRRRGPPGRWPRRALCVIRD